MANTRSSTGGANSSPTSNKTSPNGTKRKADEASLTPKSKRGRPSKAKAQKTLEETMPDAEPDAEPEEQATNDESKAEEPEETNEPVTDVEAKAEETDDAVTNGKNKPDDAEGAAAAEAGDEAAPKQNGDVTDATNGEHAEPETATKNGKEADESGEKAEGNALDQVKADAGEAGTTTTETEEKNDGKDASNDVTGDAVEEDKGRERAMPSNVLEKGIVYFFTRGRVGVEDPDSVQDLARSFFVLRPLPDGAKLTDGAIQDVGNCRLFALPKKVWPKSGKDRFMVFVEKAKTSVAALKEEFFQGSEYTTQTTGTRQTPEVSLLGEGPYAITSTGGGQGTTHLAYMLTVPSEIGEVQKDVGLNDKGSFVLSVKNPQTSASANALPTTAEYSKEIIEEFRGRAWMPAHPKHLDYQGASMLVIGEDFDGSSNLDPAPKDEKNDEKVKPEEELEKLEHEDELRVEHLKGDDTIFADLGISSKDYGLMTTW